MHETSYGGWSTHESFSKPYRNDSNQGHTKEQTSIEWIGAKQGVFGPKHPTPHTQDWQDQLCDHLLWDSEAEQLDLRWNATILRFDNQFDMLSPTEIVRIIELLSDEIWKGLRDKTLRSGSHGYDARIWNLRRWEHYEKLALDTIFDKVRENERERERKIREKTDIIYSKKSVTELVTKTYI